MIGADVRPNWTDRQARPSLTGASLICDRPVFYRQISDMQLHFEASEQAGISPAAARGRISGAV
jgi:hypothetical protein